MLSSAIISVPDWDFVSDLSPGGHVAALLSPFDTLGGREYLQLRDTLWAFLPGPSGRAIFLLRKPFKGTIAKNVLTHGTAGLNINATRVKHSSPEDFAKHKAMVDRLREKGGSLGNSWKNSSDLSGANEVTTKGRWPTNVILIHAPECRCVGTTKVAASKDRGLENTPARSWKNASIAGINRTGYADEDGKETVPVWECSRWCPAPYIDASSGNCPGMSGGGNHKADYPGGMFGGIDSSHTTYGDEGGAARFYPQFRNFEELIEWLRVLITPPGGECHVRLS